MKKVMYKFIALLLLLVSLLDTQVSYATCNSSPVISGQSQIQSSCLSIITDYFSAINQKDINTIIQLSTSSMRQLLTNIYTNSTNISNHVGIYNIASAHIDRIEFPDKSLLRPYYDEAILSQYDSFEIGLVKATVDIVDESESLVDGTAYYCVQLVEESNNFSVYDIVLVNPSLAESILSTASTQGISTPTKTNILYYPSTIKVYRANRYAGESASVVGTIQEVNFYNYSTICLQGEVGGYTNAQTLRAVAIAVRCFAFHQYLYRNSISLGFHVLDSGSNDGGTNYFLSQYYNPQLTPTVYVKNAVSSVSNYFVLDASKRLILTSHFAGKPNASGQHSGRLNQVGANYLATTQNFTFEQILHYYYDKPASATGYYNNEVATGNILVHRHNNTCTQRSTKMHTLYCSSCGNTHIVQSAVTNGHWCGGKRPQCGASAASLS